MTCLAALGLDEDMPLLTAALDELGVPHRVVAWDDDSVDWSAFGLAVVRSTWDYHRRLDEFRHWIGRVDSVTRLANSADVLRWNVDKHYLLEASGAGLPIVPTEFFEPTTPIDWSVTRRWLAAGDVVVKPAISAGSNDTERHSSETSARRHVESLLGDGRSVMVQPYVDEVDTDDETGLVFLAGSFSHAFAKGALLAAQKDVAGDLFARERIEPRVPSAAELELGERISTWLTERFGTVLYARLDLLPTATGPAIVEIELTEPSLFLHTADGAARRVAEAIRRASA